MRICLVASFGLGTYRRYLQICRYCSFMCKDQTLYAVSSYGESTFLEVCYDAVKTPQSTHRTELPSTDSWSGFCGMLRCLRLLAEESPLRWRVTSSFFEWTLAEMQVFCKASSWVFYTGHLDKYSRMLSILQSNSQQSISLSAQTRENLLFFHL